MTTENFGLLRSSFQETFMVTGRQIPCFKPWRRRRVNQQTYDTSSGVFKKRKEEGERKEAATEHKTRQDKIPLPSKTRRHYFLVFLPLFSEWKWNYYYYICCFSFLPHETNFNWTVVVKKNNCQRRKPEQQEQPKGKSKRDKRKGDRKIYSFDIFSHTLLLLFRELAFESTSNCLFLSYHFPLERQSNLEAVKERKRKGDFE